jgi:hypothetical protein
MDIRNNDLFIFYPISDHFVAEASVTATDCPALGMIFYLPIKMKKY